MLRKGQLAEIVEAGAEPRQLEFLARQPHACSQADGELGDALGMAAGVDVTGIDRSGEARRGAGARRAGAPGRELLQLGELDRVVSVHARPVLAVLLGPVEGAVDKPEQLVAVSRVIRGEGDSGA